MTNVKISIKKKIKILINYLRTNLDAVRRKINPAFIALRYKIGLYKNNVLKLHLGCGNNHFDDYINIDWRTTKATDVVCDIRKLPYLDNSVTLIESYHVIEHLNRHDFQRALKEWHRVLVIGGKLIIECPNFDEAVKEYIQGNEKRIDNIFGLQRFLGDVHQFGYNFKRLKKALENAGFTNIEEQEPQDYHTKDEPCLRIICIKDSNS
ncbi:MAG: class I SAM-dependent methyltransferase [Planctomycetota bacterium]|jgi:predicted SAM-dependent methyltransferase